MKKSLARLRGNGKRHVLAIAAVACALIVVAVASSAVVFAGESSAPVLEPTTSTIIAVSTVDTIVVAPTAQAESQTVAVSDDYPDYAPLPKHLSTQRAQQLGQFSLATVANAGLKVVDSYEISYPDTTVTQIVLAPSAPDRAGIVVIWIFKDPTIKPGGDVFGNLANRAAGPGSTAERIVVAGAADACVIANPLLAGCQGLACLSDQTVINVSSEGSGTKGKAPLDRPTVEKLLAAIVAQVQ